MKSTDEMIELNKEQAKFYDAIELAQVDEGKGGYAHNERANLLTRAWAGLRYRQQAAVAQAGIAELVSTTHMRWIESKKGGKFMELGCFSGSPSTFLLAEAAGSYLGVDLSERSIETLNRKFEDHGISHKAKGLAVDFLTMPETDKFDLIYAHGVLHHFENPSPLFDKLAALLNPAGALLFVEPSAINPIYQAIRQAYRPFQSDAAWEWPFRRHTVDALEKHFRLVDGFGWGRRSLGVSVITGLPLVGPLLTKGYVKLARAEVAAGWHRKVWHNSMVTALYELK